MALMMRTIADQLHRTITLPDQPERIISLVPSQTELLYDLGLGERVVGITKFCVRPEEWFRTEGPRGRRKQMHLDRVRALGRHDASPTRRRTHGRTSRRWRRNSRFGGDDVRDLDQAFGHGGPVGRHHRHHRPGWKLVEQMPFAFDGLVPLQPALRRLPDMARPLDGRQRRLPSSTTCCNVAA
ncbi:MAG: hypothetical protein R2810_00620 [Flavobacteriales bacterium]